MKSKNLSKTSNIKKWYIGISAFSILIIILIFIITYATYKNQSMSFSDFDPNSNPNIVESGNNGLQYIITPNGTDAYIPYNSTFSTQKQNMISRALTTLESDNINSGYVNFTNVSNSNSYTIYIIIFVFLLIIIGSIVSYAAYQESFK